MRSGPREVVVRVEGLEADGFGSARLDERLIRVKNGLPGEQVRTRILKQRRGERFSEAFEVTGVSAQRVEPACGYFPRCGGCAMMHLDYAQQLQLKQAELLRLLEEAQIQPLVVRPPTPGPQFHYRSRARFGVRVVGGQVLVGFRESFSNRVGRMDSCLTLVRKLSELPRQLKELISSLSCPDRVPQVEVAAGDRQVALLLRHLEPLSGADLARVRQFADLHGVKFYGQPGGYETLTPLNRDAEDPLLGYGMPEFGLHFSFLPTDFTQVNLAMNRKLVSAALGSLDAPRGAVVVDLFCGIGNFSLALARSGYQVRGIEAAAGAVERAAANALRNRLTGRCEFERADLYDPACRDLGPMDYLLMDPPRSGAGPNLASWLDKGDPMRVVYVSCGPRSFAKDCRVLADKGYLLEQVGIFDMFPHTAHVETLGVFQKRW